MGFFVGEKVSIGILFSSKMCIIYEGWSESKIALYVHVGISWVWNELNSVLVRFVLLDL